MRPITDSRAVSLSIGELSRRTAVHIETIRYYERVGMLPAPPRTQSGWRVYGASHCRTLGFIRRSRDLGFTLEEIRALLALGRSERASSRKFGRSPAFIWPACARSLPTSAGLRRFCRRPSPSAPAMTSLRARCLTCWTLKPRHNPRWRVTRASRALKSASGGGGGRHDHRN